MRLSHIVRGFWSYIFGFYKKSQINRRLKLGSGLQQYFQFIFEKENFERREYCGGQNQKVEKQEIHGKFLRLIFENLKSPKVTP